MLSDLLKSSFPTHSLQIHCIGLFRFKFIHPLGLGVKLCPYNNNNNNNNNNKHYYYYYYYYYYYCSGIGPGGPLHMLYNGPKGHAEDKICLRRGKRCQNGSC